MFESERMTCLQKSMSMHGASKLREANTKIFLSLSCDRRKIFLETILYLFLLFYLFPIKILLMYSVKLSFRKSILLTKE